MALDHQVEFVMPPFYFENLFGNLAPQTLSDDSRGWALALPRDARVVHAGPVADVGGVVSGAFENPGLVGAGAYLAPTPGLMSFGDVIDTLKRQGHDLSYQDVPAELLRTFSPGAEEMLQMFRYWEEYTYLGPDADEKIALARRVTTGQITDFATWAAVNLPVAGT